MDYDLSNLTWREGATADGRQTFTDEQTERWYVLVDSPGNVSVKDYCEELWLDETFESVEAAKARCQQLQNAELAEMGL